MSKSDDQTRDTVPAWIVLVMLFALLAALIALIISLLRRRETPEREPTVVRFPDANLTVIVPPQRRPVLVIERPMPPGPLESPDDEFRPGTLLVNFEVIDAENPQIPLPYFDPPITIEAAYTIEQVERAQRDVETYRKYTHNETSVAMPLLGFWDGTHWIMFTPGKNQLIYRPNADPKTGGVIVANVTRWADPPIGTWP
jgi:hypothetical protein